MSLAAAQIVNMVVGGKTPIVHVSELSAMGFAIVLYANAALQGAILGMQNALRELKERGRLDESSAMLVSFAERQRLVRNHSSTRWNGSMRAKTRTKASERATEQEEVMPAGSLGEGRPGIF